MNYRIVFLVPYYGSFPNYFKEWVYSAGYLEKQNIDFMLITDSEMEFDLPKNIHVLRLSFEQFVNKAQDKFNFKLGLSTPYKLCDFKAALGYIFEDEIKEYKFWGNCDIDQVWGDVRHFITDDILEKFDRIQFLGHFILYRNSHDINRLFMKDGAIYNYKKVLSDTMHYSFCEHSGMMKIVVKNGISNYLNINYADISPRYTRMVISRQQNYNYQIIYWENGHIYRKYIDDGNIGTDEYMYFHFQRKHPLSLDCWNKGLEPARFIYNAHQFIESDIEEIDIEYIKQYSDFDSTKTDEEEERTYKKNKLKSFVQSPLRKKILWIKQRMATRKVVKCREYFGDNYSNI